MIKFNVQAVLDSLTALIKSAAKSDVAAAETISVGYVTDAAPRLEALAAGVASGEITGKQLVSYLKDEEKNVYAEMLSFGQIIGANLQDLASQSIPILVNALNDSIAED